jgi:hypothetical protein
MGNGNQTHNIHVDNCVCKMLIIKKKNSNFIDFLKINPTITKECSFFKQKTTIDHICEINWFHPL